MCRKDGAARELTNAPPPVLQQRELEDKADMGQEDNGVFDTVT
jgi:hypothetical protein